MEKSEIIDTFIKTNEKFKKTVNHDDYLFMTLIHVICSEFYDYLKEHER